MRDALMIAIVLALAGCAQPQGDTPPSTIMPTASPSTPTPTHDPRTSILYLQIELDRETIRAGEPVNITFIATNGAPRSIWTNPQFVCTGSWDISIEDPSGNEIRVDDRDSMGCPSGGTLTTEVMPGEEIRVPYVWDGWVHPELGTKETPTPGEHTIVGLILYADEPGTPNLAGERTRLATARAAVDVA